MSETDQFDLTTLTVELLSAYVANNNVANEDLPGLILSTRAALAGTPVAETPVEAEFVPAVSIRKSLSSPDHIISMIDGKAYKTLKRHLGAHGLTIAEYRERYKLPASYPSVAPAYSEQRRATAARIGLGRKPAASGAEKPVTTKTPRAFAAGAVADDAPAPKAARKPLKLELSDQPGDAAATEKRRPGRPRKVKPEQAATEG